MFKEFIDQRLHWALGYQMALSLRNTILMPEERVAEVMRFAERREHWQHPHECKEGCQLDLKWWERGARKGAGAK